MRLKYSVKLSGLTPQIVLGAVIIADVYTSLDKNAICTITSANDSIHSPKSLHYGREGKYTDGLCRALDFRTHDFDGDKQQLLHECKEALGPDFDVVLEAEGSPNEHLHVEYDPK